MRLICSFVLASLVVATTLAEEGKRKPLDPKLVRQAGAAMDRAVEFLRKRQAEDGSFAEAEFGPAITALVTTGLLESRRVTVADPMVAKALSYLEGFVQPDGGIYVKGGQQTYPTSICLMAFSEANRGGRYQKVIDGALAFLKGQQWDEGEGISPKDPKFGGAGYGKQSRPDLSNTAFLLDALKAGGLPENDPAYKRALVFVTRCQNLSGEGANDLPVAALVNDGGFFYTPIQDEGKGKNKGTTGKGLRSYGSMTYAGLKSLIYAGLDKKDRRVQAAINWVREHYTLKENPGLGQAGLFYYYHTFAKALDVLDVDVLEDANGEKHAWRVDLLQSLLKTQRSDGSWANANKRWFENDPRLVTAYVLLAMSHATD